VLPRIAHAIEVEMKMKAMAAIRLIISGWLLKEVDPPQPQNTQINSICKVLCITKYPIRP
jgi:hypothetical protein